MNEFLENHKWLIFIWLLISMIANFIVGWLMIASARKVDKTEHEAETVYRDNPESTKIIEKLEKQVQALLGEAINRDSEIKALKEREIGTIVDSVKSSATKREAKSLPTNYIITNNRITASSFLKENNLGDNWGIIVKSNELEGKTINKYIILKISLELEEFLNSIYPFPDAETKQKLRDYIKEHCPV